MADAEKPNEEVVEEKPFEIEPNQPEVEVNTADENEQPNSGNETEEEPKEPNWIQKFWVKYKANKKVSIPLTVLAVLAVIFAIPVTRYAVAGLVIKKDVNLTVVDSKTNIAVSGVEVTLRGKSAKTDGEGKATIKSVKVGRGQLHASKKYYKDYSQNVTVPLTKPKAIQVKLEATGRQVPLLVVNKVTGQNVAGATVKAADTEVQTDQNGEATIVLPADKSKETGIVSAKGYNNQPLEITIDQQAVKQNTFALVPSGKIYFLSKQTGKIDVVKTDLDGGNRQVVLAGTGNEEDTNTVLLASRDWKYLALQSRRAGGKARLYLIDTSNDKLTEMDSGDATLTPVGWQDHIFAYKVVRENVPVWQSKNAALKTYNAETQQLVVIDETTAEGSGPDDYAADAIESVYIQKNNLVYVKRWSASYYSVYRLAGKRMGIYSAKLNGEGKQLLKDFEVGNNGYINAIASKPNEIYYGVYNGSTSYYEYNEGKLTEAKDINAETFNKFYPTYLLSPSGQSTFWYEPRDGKNTLFTGTSDGSGSKEIASLSEYITYGWFTDDYLLVSKNGSELYILPTTGVGAKGQILKISDYHKPAINFLGYGGGYGG